MVNISHPFCCKSSFRNTLQLSPQMNPRFCQINLGLTDTDVGVEIESVLNQLSLPLHVRIGFISL